VYFFDIVFPFRWRCAWIRNPTSFSIWFSTKMHVCGTESSNYERENPLLQRSRFNNSASTCSIRLVPKVVRKQLVINHRNSFSYKLLMVIIYEGPDQVVGECGCCLAERNTTFTFFG
jgi:hypothetical protein